MALLNEKVHPVAMTNSANPGFLATAATAKPFASWPVNGSAPEGYFPISQVSSAADFFKENGFVVLTGAVSAEELAALKHETAQICRNEEGRVSGMSGAAKEESDDEVMKRVLCLHFPHHISPLFERALAQPQIVDLLTRVIGPNVKAMQSMLFVKASGKPGQAWHQDEDYIPTRDRSLTGAWIALDDATIENGCLWVIPKSQKPGVLWPQKMHFDSRFDCTHESFNFPYDENESIPVEVKAGSIVFFNGYLLHRSLPNRAPNQFRRSLVNHYMSAESLLPWNYQEGVGMAQTDYRDIVMVAGEDPYAYKGTTRGHYAHVRADGQGGCIDWNDETAKKNRENLIAAVAATKKKEPVPA